MEAARRRRLSNKQDAEAQFKSKKVAKAKETKPPRDLEFVNLGSSPRLDDESKERVRSHAMIHFNRRKLEQDSGSTSPDQSPYDSSRRTSPSLVCSRGRFRLAGTRARPSKKHPEVQCQIKSSSARKTPIEVSSGQQYSSVESRETNLPTQCGGEFELLAAESHTALPELGKLHFTPHLVDFLGSRSIDPFDSLPVAISKRGEALIDHYHALLLSTPLMNAARAQWFDLAITDSALLHVALSHSATTFALLQGSDDSHESLALRTEAIRIINKRIDESNGGKLDDFTIGAVASLAGYEAINGSLNSVRTHIHGLEQMVTIRGGLANGEFGPAIRRLILWADLGSANALSTTPRFTPPYSITSNDLMSGSNPVSSDETDRILSSEISFSLSNLPDLPALEQILKATFLDLRKLTDILNSDHTTPHLKVGDVSYGDAIYSVQREFMSIIRLLGENRESGHTSCSIAGLIYVECCLRDVSPSSRIVCDLVDRLVDSLEDLEKAPRYQAAGGIFNHSIFWVLFIGAAAAERTTIVREKLVRWLAFVCRRLMHEPWIKTQQTLKRISWLERGGRLVGPPVWEEVTQGSPSTSR